MLSVNKVEGACKSLSTLCKSAIRKKLLVNDPNIKLTPSEYSFGEALVFWVIDWLTRVKLLNAEQLQLVIQEFTAKITQFGNQLETQENQARFKSYSGLLTLPMCKLGFLDRKLMCMDGYDQFLDLETGDLVPATDNKPLEVIGYNLTVLFMRYHTQANRVKSCSAEQDLKS